MKKTIEQSIKEIRGASASAITADICFPASAPVFKGHFPGAPIVPAVYQMALCRMIAERYYAGTFVLLSRSRFSVPCVPDVLYTMKITVEEPSAEPGRAALHCSFWRADVMHSKIVLLYERPVTRG